MWSTSSTVFSSKRRCFFILFWARNIIRVHVHQNTLSTRWRKAQNFNGRVMGAPAKLVKGFTVSLWLISYKTGRGKKNQNYSQTFVVRTLFTFDIKSAYRLAWRLNMNDRKDPYSTHTKLQIHTQILWMVTLMRNVATAQNIHNHQTSHSWTYALYKSYQTSQNKINTVHVLF